MTPSFTMRAFVGPLALCLFLSGCTRQQVNSYSPFKYRASDDTGTTLLKSAGNLAPWTFEAALLGVGAATVGALWVGIAYLQARAQEAAERGT